MLITLQNYCKLSSYFSHLCYLLVYNFPDCAVNTAHFHSFSLKLFSCWFCFQELVWEHSLAISTAHELPALPAPGLLLRTTCTRLWQSWKSSFHCPSWEKGPHVTGPWFAPRVCVLFPSLLGRSCKPCYQTWNDAGKLYVLDQDLPSIAQISLKPIN